MRIVKISAIWCGGCLVMNKVWENIKKNYPEIEFITLDYDMDEDEVKKYNVGDILPVLIFYKDDIEVRRIDGEIKEKILLDDINQIDDYYEGDL